MLNNLLTVLELMGVTALGAMIFFDLVAASKRRPSPVKIPARINRNRR
jgi:hypothetical protein